jgi:hypothetical protein
MARVKDDGENALQGRFVMRIALIVGSLIGLLAGFFVSGQVATSQEEPFSTPEPEGRGRFQIAGHSTYPPLLLDSETGTSWILMSTAEGEDRHWVWEPIELGALPPNPSQNTGRDIARTPGLPRPSHRQISAAKSRPFSW